MYIPFYRRLPIRLSRLLAVVLFLLSVHSGSAQKCYVQLVVAYTAEAAAQAGSDSLIVQQIRSAVTDMNQAYVNSGVNHWIELVRTIRTSYAESGCFQQDLTAFWLGDGPAMSYCHWLRQQYHADLAALLITNTQFCGLPVSDSSVATAATAYCAVQYQCMLHNYSLSHMLGHLYGCGHAQFELDPPAQGVSAPYAHGYNWNYNEYAHFNTIMGVTDDVDCYGQGQNNCTLINYFSNPAISYQGVATGSQYANNALVLNTQAPTVANFLTLPVSYTLNDTVTTSDFATAIALDTLRTGSSFVGNDSANIYFKAGRQIVLSPGFRVDSTVHFRTILDTTLFNCGSPVSRAMKLPKPSVPHKPPVHKTAAVRHPVPRIKKP